jgi:hypothetical protein
MRGGILDYTLGERNLSNLITVAFAYDPISLSVFSAMLTSAQICHPLGLPDRALQQVFADHQDWICGLKAYPEGSLQDRQEADIQKTGVYCPLRRKLVYVFRS